MKLNHKLQNKIDLLWELVKTSFKLRYQNSVLGFLWVLIKPYSTFAVMYFIWNHLSKSTIDNFAEYLLVGIVTYTYFNELVLLGQKSLLERANIILKVNFPRYIAITSSLISALINLGINMVLVFGLLIYQGMEFDILKILYFFMLVISLFIFGIGLSFFTSILTVRLRDLENVFELGLFLLYWATPIFYDIKASFIEGRVGEIIKLNPLGIFINQVRYSLSVYGELNWQFALAFGVFSIVFTILGWTYFKSNVKKVAEYF